MASSGCDLLVNGKGGGCRDDRLRSAAQIIFEECEAGSFPGASFLVWRAGSVVLQGSVGCLSPERSHQVTPDTIFDMASVTKPMTAALMALLLAEEGRFSVLQKVPEFFPERPLAHLAGVSVEQLLTHTSGLPAWVELYAGTTDAGEAFEKLLNLPLEAPPGKRYEYSCLGYILLGKILERVSGETLQSFLKRRVWDPLEMPDTGYCPPEEKYGRIASTMHCPARPGQEITGQVHDGNAWVLGGISGNAGLFSTPSDILKFCLNLLDADDQDCLVSRLARNRMLTSQISPDVGGQSIGWFCKGNDMLPSADFLPADTFGHTGYTGTCVLMAPSEHFVSILLTNRVCLDRDGSRIRRTRRRFHNRLASAII